MYLLESEIKVDFTNMSIEHSFVVLSFILVLFTVVFIIGFSLKFGDKEVNIGGLHRLLARKDEDALLKESLHNFSLETDHEINGNLYDLVDTLNYEIEGVAVKDRCYFTFEKFISIVKTELEKRVRRNNLKEKLVKKNREKYVELMLADINCKYELLQSKVSLLKCGESYAQLSVIKNQVRGILYQFFDGANAIHIEGCRKKIKRYNEDKGKFKTGPARVYSCEYPIKKNEEYIKELEGGINAQG